jgi:hypothetical protein
MRSARWRSFSCPSSDSHFFFCGYDADQNQLFLGTTHRHPSRPQRPLFQPAPRRTAIQRQNKQGDTALACLTASRIGRASGLSAAPPIRQEYLQRGCHAWPDGGS